MTRSDEDTIRWRCNMLSDREVRFFRARMNQAYCPYCGFNVDAYHDPVDDGGARLAKPGARSSVNSSGDDDFKQDSAVWNALSPEAQGWLKREVLYARDQRMRAWHDREYQPRAFDREFAPPSGGVPAIEELVQSGLLQCGYNHENSVRWSDQAVRIMGQLHPIKDDSDAEWRDGQ